MRSDKRNIGGGSLPLAPNVDVSRQRFSATPSEVNAPVKPPHFFLVEVLR